MLTRSLLPVAALLLGAAFLFAASGMNGLILPIRGSAEGMSTLTLGLLGTGWACGHVFGCLRVPVLVARVGHVRAFSVMSSLASLSILASVVIIWAPAWIAFRAVGGFALAGAAMIVESWLVERTEPTQRGRVFGFYTMIILGASVVGQLSLSFGSTEGFLFFVLAAALYCLSLIPTAISSSALPQPLLRARLDLSGLWRNSPLALVGAFAIGISNGTFGTLAAVYAGELGLPVSGIALFVAIPILAGALTQLPVGLLSDRFDRRLVLCGVLGLGIAADIAFLQLRPTSELSLVVLAAVFGMAIFAMYPLVVAHANDHASGDDAITISGGILLMFGIGSIVGPLIGGGLMSAVGPQGLFLLTLTAHLMLLGYTVLRMRLRAAVSVADKEPFAVQAPAGSATQQTAPFGGAHYEALADDDENGQAGGHAPVDGGPGPGPAPQGAHEPGSSAP